MRPLVRKQKEGDRYHGDRVLSLVAILTVAKLDSMPMGTREWEELLLVVESGRYLSDNLYYQRGYHLHSFSLVAKLVLGAFTTVVVG